MLPPFAPISLSATENLLLMSLRMISLSFAWTHPKQKRMAFLLAWTASLEACTKEKLHIVAGPEFRDQQGNGMVVVKALCGTCTSGARFHEKFADTLLAVQFLPCKADPNVWMKDCGAHCEHTCVYVDDLAVMTKDPSAFFAEPRDRKHKLKGVGEMSCHLGGDLHCDPDGTLAWGAKTHCKHIVNQCESIFGALPKERTSPVGKDDHQELDKQVPKTSNTIRASSDLSNGQHLSAIATSAVQPCPWGDFVLPQRLVISSG
jgi:hypothetical protein